MVEESSKTAAWKVQAEEAHKKISLLEKELQYRDAVNKLLSADIEVLTYAAKVPMGKEALALKQVLVSKTSAEVEALLQ